MCLTNFYEYKSLLFFFWYANILCNYWTLVHKLNLKKNDSFLNNLLECLLVVNRWGEGEANYLGGNIYDLNIYGVINLQKKTFPADLQHRRSFWIMCFKKTEIYSFVTTPSSRINAPFCNSIMWFIFNLQRKMDSQRLRKKYIHIYK